MNVLEHLKWEIKSLETCVRAVIFEWLVCAHCSVNFRLSSLIEMLPLADWKDSVDVCQSCEHFGLAENFVRDEKETVNEKVSYQILMPLINCSHTGPNEASNLLCNV